MPDVTTLLRTDILNGEFPPGMRLVELQLTERYSVGRSAIRSSIVELVAEGLVVHEPNRGATVRRLSVETAIEIAQARAVLEGILARHAAEKATQDERDELSQVIVDMRKAVDDGDHFAYSGLNRVLHRRIREIGNHEIASELVANLRNRGAHQEFQLALRPGRSSVSLPQHQAIVEAIVAGDAKQAELAMHEHLESVQHALREWSA